VAAEHVPALPQPTLVEQVQVVSADDRREGIRVVHLAHAAVFQHAQQAGPLGPLAAGPLEQAGGMQSLQGRKPGREMQPHLLCMGAEHAQAPAVAGAMQPEQREGVVQLRGQQLVDQRIGHEEGVWGGGHRRACDRQREAAPAAFKVAAAVRRTVL
jgi:hypothetical protein